MRQAERIDWVDYAKGFCIIFVVMMHSTLGVEKAAGAEGWMGHVVAFAQPFRMPDFFLISGLFLSLVIDRDWRSYLDKKVIHFVYFYALWVTIQFAIKAPGFASELGWDGTLLAYLEAYVEPFGTLWFIYILPIFFVVTKLARQVGIPWQVMLVVAAALEIAPIETGALLVDEFAGRFVFFYAGYVFAPHVFRLAAWAMAHAGPAIAGLAIWGLVNGILVAMGFSHMPFVSLGLGAIGATAVVLVSALLSRVSLFGFLRFCGENSIVVYLAFFLPMGVSRAALLKTGIITDLGTISVLVTAAGVIGPLMLFWIVRGTRFDFLFKRPAWATLGRAKTPALQPAE
ncbi:acyltransferase [Breoghania sp. L-A4]|nr:acyltransferase [Breoghania sp. L-A4]